jgi:hypothetical protein
MLTAAGGAFSSLVSVAGLSATRRFAGGDFEKALNAAQTTVAMTREVVAAPSTDALLKQASTACRQGALFGANVGVVYTPAFSRTFTLVDPTPLETVNTTVTTDSEGTKQVTTVLEAKRVEEQSRETRAGQLAALLNVRLLQAIAPQTAIHWLKPGVAVGFGIDTSKPSLLLGGSLEIFKYFRVGAGAAWVSTTDAVTQTSSARRCP